MASQPKHSVLFVCLGNICRSPTSELVMIQEVHALGIQADWKIDSAGTAAYHVGEPPDSRGVAEVKKAYGDKMLPITTRARQVRVSDFTEFDYVLCMDESNLANLKRLAKSTTPTAKIALLGSYDPEGEQIISDPYYGGQSGFAHNLAQIQRSIGALLAENGYGAGGAASATTTETAEEVAK